MWEEKNEILLYYYTAVQRNIKIFSLLHLFKRRTGGNLIALDMVGWEGGIGMGKNGGTALGSGLVLLDVPSCRRCGIA